MLFLSMHNANTNFGNLSVQKPTSSPNFTKQTWFSAAQSAPDYAAVDSFKNGRLPET